MAMNGVPADPPIKNHDSKIKGRIIVVDDDLDFGQNLCINLELLGYQASYAESSYESQQVLQNFPAEVALIDIMLGQEDGIELIRDFDRQGLSIFCVMITGYATIDNAIKALREGAYDYLCKPIHQDDLLSTLERCFCKLELEQQAQQAKNELVESQVRLRNLIRKLDNVREEERKNIAHDIHDDLGQTLTALKLDVSWLVVV